jgi:hypothetical protein
MSGSRQRPKPVCGSQRIYLKLLVLYPRTFRGRYAESMAQLFRDQWREAQARGTRTALSLFWLRILTDLGISSCHEHWNEMGTIMRSAFRELMWRKPKLAFLSIFVAMLVLLEGVLAVVIQPRLPKSYSSTARLKVPDQIQGERSRNFSKCVLTGCS